MAGTFECSILSGENHSQCCMESWWTWLLWPAGGVGRNCLVYSQWLSELSRKEREGQERTEREDRLRHKVVTSSICSAW